MNMRKSVLFGVICGFLAMGGLAAQAGEDSAATLIGKLKSTDKAVQLQAIDELGELGDKAAEAVAPLVELLKDESAKARAHAACALGKIGSPAKPAVPALAELLKDPDETVRRQVVRAVMHIRPGPQVAIPLCVKLLEDSDPGIRVRVLSALADAGSQAVPGLIEALKNDQAAYWACLVLRDMGPVAKDAVPAITERISDSRPEVRREAILALAAMGDAAAPAVGQIAAALSDQLTAAAATYALGRIGQIPADAEAIIRANVNGDDKMLSVNSLWAVARVHPEDKQIRRAATARLIERLKDEDPLVRVAAAHALAALPPAPEITGPIWEKALQDADETTVRNALDALAALGPAAVPRLVDALKHEKFRGHVVYILGQIGPPTAPATPALTKLIAGKDERIALEAAIALAKIGPGAKDAVPALIEALGQANNPNQHAIAYALGKIGPDAAGAAPALSDLLKSPDRKLALVSAWALVQIRPAAEVAEKTLPVLIAGLDEDLPLARRGAVEAMGRFGASLAAAGDSSAVQKILPALRKSAVDKDPDVRAAVEEAVKSIRKSLENVRSGDTSTPKP